MSVLTTMTPEQREKVTQPTAASNPNIRIYLPVESPVCRKTAHFHSACRINTPSYPVIPTLEDREKRLRFILEEFLELVEAMGFEIAINNDSEVTGEVIENGAEYVTLDAGGKPVITVRPAGIARYDMVEVADALGDLNVVVNGTGVEFGLPMPLIDHEIYMSNMSKVPPNGEPIRNGITEGYRAGEPGHRADAPEGKILKPESFVPPNIPAVLYRYVGY